MTWAGVLEFEMKKKNISFLPFRWGGGWRDERGSGEKERGCCFGTNQLSELGGFDLEQRWLFQALLRHLWKNFQENWWRLHELLYLLETRGCAQSPLPIR